MLTQARAAAPSYPEVGATKSATLPADYRHDRYGVRVGDGSDMFERAIRALRRWQPQTDAGVAVVPRDAWALRMRPSCCFFEPRCFGRPRRAGSCTSLKKPTSSVSPTALFPATPRKERSRSRSAGTASERSTFAWRRFLAQSTRSLASVRRSLGGFKSELHAATSQHSPRQPGKPPALNGCSASTYADPRTRFQRSNASPRHAAGKSWAKVSGDDLYVGNTKAPFPGPLQ